ncbi:hypothetical protein LTR10_013117 [Elasticomyces elasticus]|uniref:Uncharacterized protein n=1 Tax=Exophiala sideris TaxID=1016849 RepID=A0ABR0JB59_9EURO|nr:hypothetical protein LTR10_013117 [Elasticomyces elasticus]KAK5030492.1 hypothetical protein LTS07_005276 [Exophiala sideris]KAK5038546.1 hypothetical protein LTR13_004293 [Exophiala sideris]KAK5060427.1 hypothetical protein LTR69_005744 [Exophiala sideris]KAK5183339.1 hypothetical protein LTR44_004340 [Eurotiomycetes sp. CCFEE 6388]
MHWINNFQSLQLDIVGIIAVLGEGSVTRNAQVTSLSWWSILPRFLPAPQALLEHERKYRLPTAPGIVAGAYSGTVKKEINFFAQLLHQKPLDDFEVELVEVLRKKEDEGPSFGPRPFGPLFGVTLLGFAMAMSIIALSVHYDDGFALFSTIMLSMVSCTVGIGTRWDIAFTEPKIKPERRKAMPRSDVVIYYPNGSMRVVRVQREEIARLYFQTEHAQYKIEDTPYRILAVLSTIMLMAGVVSLANASNILQVAFAAAYIVLNGIYWTVSALNPFRFHWRHAYEIRRVDFALAPLPAKQDSQARNKGHVNTSIGTTQTPGGPIAATEHTREMDVPNAAEPTESNLAGSDKSNAAGLTGSNAAGPNGIKAAGPNISNAAGSAQPNAAGARNFTAALWTAIMLTGTSQWLNEATTIAPMNEPWKKWLLEAEIKAQPIDEHEDRFKLHRSSAISPLARRVSTNVNWKLYHAGSTPEAYSPRRLIIPHSIGGWRYDVRLTEILEEYTPKTRKPYPGEIDETVEPLEANNALAQGTSAPVKVLAFNMARRVSGFVNPTTPADSNAQAVHSTPIDLERLHV